MRTLLPASSAPAGFRPHRRWPAIAAAAVTAAAGWSAAAAEPMAWQGSFHSRTQDKDIAVRLDLPAAARGSLRFVTLVCAVGLDPAPTAAGTLRYTIVPGEDVAGPYCGSWLGGSLQAAPVEGGQRLRVSISHRKSTITVTLSPAAP